MSMIWPMSYRAIQMLLLGLLLVATRADAAEQSAACATSRFRVGECFGVHGRLTTCTGVPNARIWIIWTHRVLGITDADGNPAGRDLLPGNLDRRMFSLPPCEKAAFGDFIVCPLTPSRPRVMQRVCVASATKIIIRDW